MKCYIIFYLWKKNENVWTPTETITTQHPLDWLIETRNEMEDYQISLVNWKEENISKDRFKYIEDNIN